MINGQKIWTSGGHLADWGWLAARTDPDAPKHKGISLLMLDMKSPGIKVRPLINMGDQHSFNEVFFEDVRVPVEQRVGEENRGWYHLAVALDFERSGIGAYAGGRRTIERFTSVVKERPELWEHRNTLRHELAERALEVNVGTFLAYRVATMQAQGLVPNHEASASKLFGSELTQRLQLTGMHILGMSGMLRGASSRVPFDQAQVLPALGGEHGRGGHERDPAQHHGHPRSRPPEGVERACATLPTREIGRWRQVLHTQWTCPNRW